VLTNEVDQQPPGVYECRLIVSENAYRALSRHELDPPLCLRIVEHPDDVREGPEVLEIDALPQHRGDRFAARTGFDPRSEAAPYRWFRIFPRRIQAWHEANELPDRELMRDGRWLA
jgi:hypothetical protein